MCTVEGSSSVMEMDGKYTERGQRGEDNQIAREARCAKQGLARRTSIISPRNSLFVLFFPIFFFFF